MAKSKKGKVSQKALSYGNLYTQEAVTQFLSNFGKQPETDEVLKKAGIARHRLRILLDDDEIAQAVETRLDALLATPFRIEPSNTPESQLIHKELTAWFTEIMSGAFNSLLFGYSVLEAVYEVGEYVGIGWIGEKPMQWFEPKNDGRLIYRSNGTGVENAVDQIFKFFLTRRKATYEQPYGKALLATLYWLYFFKQNGFKFWAKFLERFGTPILLGKTDSDTQDMANALLSAHAQSVIAVDKDDDVQILSNGASNAGASFELFNTSLLRQIQKVVLGQTLTSGTDGTGSRALGEVHENVRKDKLKSDIRLVTPTLQSIVDALCAINAWQNHKVILGEQTKQLNKERAERDATLKEAGLQFTKQYFVNNYGFEDGDIAEVTISPQQQFTALPSQTFKFGAKPISNEQLEVDSLSDRPIQLLSDDDIKQIVADSENIEDMQNKLFSLLASAESSQFNNALDRALFTADVMGFVHSKEGK